MQLYELVLNNGRSVSPFVWRAKMALAHKVGDKVEEAYRRGSGLKRRRALMQDWAKFVGASSP